MPILSEVRTHVGEYLEYEVAKEMARQIKDLLLSVMV